MKTALAIAAHPDDIEFMMAGTLLLLGQAGFALHYITLSSGNCGSMEMSPAKTRLVRRAEADLPAAVARVAPGTSVQLKIAREGKPISLPITVGEMKDSEVIASIGPESDLGLTVQPVTPDIAQSLGLERAEGLVVASVKPGSAADDAGLRSGDVITQINRHPVKNLADYNREISRTEKTKSVLFLVHRGESSVFLALKR